MVFITIKKVHEMGLDYRLALEQSLVSCYQISYCNFFLGLHVQAKYAFYQGIQVAMSKV